MIPSMLEITEMCCERKLYFIFLVMGSFTFCCGRHQTEKCLIQSFYRKTRGNGISGSGNLLWVRHFNTIRLASTDLSFTGSCINSANETEFLMKKKARNGSLVVSFFWPADDAKYVLAIRNKTLLMESTSVVHKLQSCHQFVYADINSDGFDPPSTLKCTSSHSYLRSDSYGRPSVGRNSSDVTTWFRIIKTSVCDTDYPPGK